MTDHADLNAAIRRAAGPVGRLLEGNPESAINRAIRAAAGHPPGPEPGAGEPEPTPDDRLRALVATDAGLPVEWGERLRGDTPAELAADASLARHGGRASAGCRLAERRIRWRG